ncbi:MAG: tRNA guanosine(34) transglycosylase Tgt [Oscillospiraceae bacterium]|jgi:queuine tRNA-ribosyltransferase|nr:tRNA guanosine(34) transglycosylase Tgt [Oscillospiraceae bacterium]
MSAFTVLREEGHARRAVYATAHGDIHTPVFMNVATQAAMKGGLAACDLRRAGCSVVLANAYHLHLRPGEDTVRSMGGLHGFMRWSGPMLTDSGGFQVYSLAGRRKITDEGAEFASHIDGARVFIGPRESVRIQTALGADIIMAFDECVESTASREVVQSASERTLRWLDCCIDEHGRAGQGARALWGINQGGVYEDIRADNLLRLQERGLPGVAIGGLAVGEEKAAMYHILDILCPLLHKHIPRYLMGVGTPEDILQAVSRGIDFFDCVLPARNGRHGHLYTRKGKINIKNARYRLDENPIDEQCGCEVCALYTRAYLRHLFTCGELLALRLGAYHNLYYYNSLMAQIRQNLENGTFNAFRKAMTECWTSGP